MSSRLNPVIGELPVWRSRWWRMAALLLAAQVLTLLLLAAMLVNKQQHLLVELTLSRIEIQAADLAGTLRTGALSGLHVSEMEQLAGLVQRLLAAEPGLAEVEIVGFERAGASIVFAGRTASVGHRLSPAEWRAMAASEGFQHGMVGAQPTLTSTVRDGADEIVAGLRLYAAEAPLAAGTAKMIDALTAPLAVVAVLMTVSMLAALAWLRRHPDLRRRVLLFALAVMIAAGAAIAGQARAVLAASLQPAIASKLGGVADLLAGKLERAAALAIPLDQIPRLAAYFAEIVERHPEVAAVRLIAGDGRLLTQHGDATDGWIERAAGPALLAVAGDARFVDHRLLELAADIAIVALVAVLVFRELLAALLARLPAGNATAAADLDRVQELRLPLFLFILSEELSRASLPLYLASFAEPSAGWRPETAVGVAIAVYMACFALATPFAGKWTDRWGMRRVFAAGVVLSVGGFAWAALADAYWQLLPARALCALGYAAATMAGQRQLIVLGGEAQRARALALFVSAVSIAAICGTALGGVLADQFGSRWVLAASAIAAALGWLSYRRMSLAAGGDAAATRPAASLRFAELLRLLGRRRFAALMLGSALPTKIALAGLLFYLTPLVLHELGQTPAAIGRVMMSYFLLVAAINPLAAWLADRHGWRQSLTIAGGVVIGGAALLAGSGLLPAEHALWLAIAGLGVGTGLASAAMQSLALRLAAPTSDTAVTVAVRMLERLGSVIGPLWIGFWLAGSGASAALTALGVTVLAASLVCLGAQEHGRQTAANKVATSPLRSE
ncbi:MAG TPA: MFS transporter [Accumulibacter sp.]|nr:MFS transporter [Accumulibacter sp.]